MKELLEKHLHNKIGINCSKAFRIEAATLIHLGNEYFSVVEEETGYTRHFPWHNVIQIIEHPSGVEVGGLFSHKDKHAVVIKVGHLTEVVPT